MFPEPFGLDSSELILGCFFFGFFAVTALAVHWNHRRWVREGYLAGFFALLLVTNLTGLSLFPFMSWHKFSEPLPEEVTRYELRVVDTEGDELLYDARATPPMLGPHFWTIGERMATEYSDERVGEVGQFYLTRAREYRHSVERNEGRVSVSDVVEFLDFPRHVLDRQWSARELSEYSSFTSLRVYRVTFDTGSSGTEVQSYSERLVLEVTEDGTVTRHVENRSASARIVSTRQAPHHAAVY